MRVEFGERHAPDRWGQDAPRDWVRRAGQHSTPVQRTVAGYMAGSTETANASV